MIKIEIDSWKTKKSLVVAMGDVEREGGIGEGDEEALHSRCVAFWKELFELWRGGAAWLQRDHFWPCHPLCLAHNYLYFAQFPS